MTYQPSCLISWKSAVAGMDECGRTVKQVMEELNRARQTIQEVEAMPVPRSELALMRKETAEWIAHRALVEAQAVIDMRAALKRAKEA